MKREELWRDIAEVGEKYAVSNFGRVRNNETKKILRGAISSAGYLTVALQCGGRQKTFLIHRLVADAFVDGKTKERRIVNHIDGNKTNNYVDNLEWCSYYENLHHARKNLGHYAGRKRTKVLCVNTGEIFGSIVEAAIAKGVNEHNILSVLKQRRTHAGGFFWWYPDEPLPDYKANGRYPVVCVETGEVFSCAKEAMSKYSAAGIYQVLNGNRKTAGGYHWKRITPKDIDKANK